MLTRDKFLKRQLIFSFQILDKHPETRGRRRPVVKTINVVNNSGAIAIGGERAITNGAPLNHPTGISMMR